MATLGLKNRPFKSRKQREEDLILAAKVKRIHRLYDQGYTIKDIIGDRSLLTNHFPDTQLPRASQSLGTFNNGAENRGSQNKNEETKQCVSLADIPKPVTYAMSLAHIRGKGQETGQQRKASLWKMCYSKTVTRNNGIVTTSQQSSSEYAIPGTSRNIGNNFAFASATNVGNTIGGNTEAMVMTNGSSSQLSARGSMRNFPRPIASPSQNMIQAIEPPFAFGDETSDISNMQVHKVQQCGSQYFGNKLMSSFKKPFDAEKMKILDRTNFDQLDPRNLNIPFQSPWINRSQISRGGISGASDFNDSASMFSDNSVFRNRIPVKDLMEILSRRDETSDIYQSQMLAPEDEGMHYLNPINDDVEEMHD